MFDAAAHLEGIGDMLRTVLGSPAILELNVADRPLPIDVDMNQFETTLVNLVANARDAMSGQGILTIRADQERGPDQQATGAFARITISDTGCGIPADQIDRIFEPFFTTKDVGRGTGLGLSQVYGFVHQSGGWIHVESEVGHGTALTLHLPLSIKAIEPRQDNARDAEDVDTSWNVLVIEDNLDVGEFSTQLLLELGYRTVLARNAAEALRLLDENPTGFDVVLTDIVMPGMDGVTLGNEIRRRLPTIPVVLNSGYSHVLAQNNEHGFELIQKPYSIDDLSRALRHALAGRRARPSSP